MMNSLTEHHLIFSIDPLLKQKGISVKAAVFANPSISNRNAALEQRKKEIMAQIESLGGDTAILKEYQELHNWCGISSAPPPASALLDLVRKSQRLPQINTLVDAYNLVVLETSLSIGAHDLAQIKGQTLNITLARGDERYVPLGQKDPQPLKKEEYICRDDEKVICWLDIKQCEETALS